MRRVCLGLVFMLVLAGFARPASAAVITFNEAGLVPGFGPAPYYSGSTKGTTITDQLASLGVLFSVSEGGAAYVTSGAFVGAGPSSMSGNFLAINTTPYTSGSWATLTASFVDPLTGNRTTANGFSVTAWDTNNDPTRMTATAFDIDGNWLESYSLASLANTFQFKSSNIGRIEFYDTGGDGHVIDNFSYRLNPASTQVPEPASVTLFGIGSAALALVRRRRRQ